ncbi:MULTISPECIES: glycosyltransferase family 39 protein [unclassified Ruegeria]|uniref:glycosyltransferase family 39 protein n=1 Tax=unclassified Ruegeria TaxID=2625375 RepID=UPI001AE74986|nr:MULTISPECIES: glycosyltransferase family 39 protein [unclassified Ruegeria]
MTQHSREIGRHDLAVLLFILLFAAVLRTAGLNAPLWYDEIWTVDTHVRLPWGEMMGEYSMNHHYFFSMKAKLFSQIFGEEAWVYRFPAALFGVGTVGAIWWLAKDVAGTWTAHISALLVALSYHQVWFSQNARGYTELAFWSVLGLILFLRGVKRPVIGIWVGFGLTAAAAVFTHLTGAFFFVALGFVWLLSLTTGFGRGGLTRAWVVQPLIGVTIAVVLILLAYLPILPSLVGTMSEVSATSAVDPMQEYQNPLWTIIEGLRTAVGNTGPLTLVVAIGGLVAIAFGAVGTHATQPLFFPSIVAHVVVTLIILLSLEMRIWPRFFFVDIAPVILLVVVGCGFGSRVVAGTLRRPGLEQPLFAIGVLAITALSVVLVQRNYVAPKQDLAGAFALVENTRRPSERVYAINPGGPIFENHFNADWTTIGDSTHYSKAMSQPGPVALVVLFPNRMFRTIPELARDAEGRLDFVHGFAGTLGDGDVLVYRRK